MPFTAKLLAIREDARHPHRLENTLRLDDEEAAVVQAKAWAWKGEMRRAEVWNEAGTMVFYTSRSQGYIRVYQQLTPPAVSSGRVTDRA